jgi:hypothetical protein
LRPKDGFGRRRFYLKIIRGCGLQARRPQAAREGRPTRYLLKIMA